MPALTDLLTKMGTSGEIALTIAVLALLGLIVFIIYRTVFSHRLRVPGGRTRQPRLGVVDAFSVDGQRQLVLVRRDNVEHLILIGGPNDVLVESQIVRMAAPAQQNGAASVAAVASPPPPPPPQAVAAPTPPAPTVIRPLRPPPSTPDAAARRPDPVAAPAVAPASPTVAAPPARPTAPRTIAPARPFPTPIARPPLPQPIAPAARRSAPPVAAEAAAFEPVGSGAPPVTPPPPLAAPAPAAPHAHVVEVAAPAAGPLKPAEFAVKAPAVKTDDPFADLDALEAEMSRLLGRETK